MCYFVHNVLMMETLFLFEHLEYSVYYVIIDFKKEVKMPIKSIEIMCIPCPKCERIKKLIFDTIKLIELQNKIKIIYDLKLTSNLLQVSKYSVNPSKAPIVIINGNVEFAGEVKQEVVKSKLEALHKY